MWPQQQLALPVELQALSAFEHMSFRPLAGLAGQHCYHGSSFVQVGDYVLSPEICVERKSLSDLRQSFISGRLYYQASAMTRHYTTPVLLIEFQRDAAFVLHSPSDISDEIQVHSF